MPTDYRAWRQENLAQLAFDLTTKIADLEAELRHAKSDLKTAIKAYQQLNKEKNDQGIKDQVFYDENESKAA